MIHAGSLPIHENWIVQIDLQIPYRHSKNWRNVFSLQADGRARQKLSCVRREPCNKLSMVIGS